LKRVSRRDQADVDLTPEKLGISHEAML